MAAYASLADYKQTRTAARDGKGDPEILAALEVAAADIDEWCQRSFTVATGTETAKVYRYTVTGRVLVDDFANTTQLVVSDNGSTCTIDEDFYVEAPYQSGHPYYRLVFSPDRWRGSSAWRPLLSVSADWGWSAVPDQVVRANVLLAADLLQAGVASFGAVTFQDAGTLVRIRQNLIVEGLLRSFRRADRTAL